MSVFGALSPVIHHSWLRMCVKSHTKLSLYLQTALFSTDSLFPLIREAPVSHFTDSFTCSPCVLSLVCTLKLHCSVLNLSPDCLNKPRQTGRRQRRDVTHSSEPWRLSAWRRAGGRYGDLKQQALIPPFTCIARKPWEQTGCGDHHSFITLSHSDDITAPRTCKDYLGKES